MLTLVCHAGQPYLLCHLRDLWVQAVRQQYQGWIPSDHQEKEGVRQTSALLEQSVLQSVVFLRSLIVPFLAVKLRLPSLTESLQQPTRTWPRVVTVESLYLYALLRCSTLTPPTRTTLNLGLPLPPPTHRPRCCLSLLLPVQAELQSVRAQCAGSAPLPLRLCETWRAEVRQQPERPQTGAERLTAQSPLWNCSQVGQEHPEGEDAPSYCIARWNGVLISSGLLSRDAPPMNPSINQITTSMKLIATTKLNKAQAGTLSLVLSLSLRIYGSRLFP